MNHDINEDRTLAETQIDDLLDDIEIRCRTDVAAARGMSVLSCNLGVDVRPGNATERHSHCVAATASEIRSQGMTSHAVEPVTVGNVFHLTFDRSGLDVEPQLAVCDRCTMLGDSSFEARFRFVNEIQIPSETSN